MDITEFKKDVNHEMLALTVVFERLGFAVTGCDIERDESGNWQTLRLTRKLF